MYPWYYEILSIVNGEWTILRLHSNVDWQWPFPHCPFLVSWSGIDHLLIYNSYFWCSVIHLWVNQCWRWTKNKVFCLIFHHVFSWHLQRRMTDKTEREHKIRMRKSKEELKGREKDEKHYTKCKRSPTKGWSPPPLVRRCSYDEKQGSTMTSSHTLPCLRWGRGQVRNYNVEFLVLRAP